MTVSQPHQSPTTPPPHDPTQGQAAPSDPYQGPGAPSVNDPYQTQAAPAPYDPYQGQAAPVPYDPYQGQAAPAPYDPYQAQSPYDPYQTQPAASYQPYEAPAGSQQNWPARPYESAQPPQQYWAPQPVDTGSFGWAVLGFFVPIAGLVLWLVWKDTKPRDSRMSRNGFIAGIALTVAIWVIYIVAILIIAVAASGS